MNRIELIKEIFRRSNFNSYLEIGTHGGSSFLPIRCKNKIAIDPNFVIPWEKKAKWFIKNPHNFRSKYFEETSDDFFRNRQSYLQRIGEIDVVLIDGLHTFQAALNDILNSLNYLNTNGIIVLHDCLPPDEAAALPTKQFPTEAERDIEGWTNQWNGDVWKSIVYLRRNLFDLLDVFVLDTDWGLGIVRIKDKIDRELKIDKDSFDEIDSITYSEMIPKAKEILGVRDVAHISTLLDEIANSQL